MSRHFTIQQVEQHNVKQVFDPYAVIDGGVYRLKKVPWEQCKTNPISKLKSLTVSASNLTTLRKVPREVHGLNLE